MGLRLMDLTLIAFAFPLAYAVRDGLVTASLPGLYPIARYWPFVALSLLLWIGAASIARVYDVYRTRSITSELFRMSRAVGVQALLVAAAGFLLHQHDVSRLLVGIYLVISWALLGGSRVVVRLVAHAARRRGYNTRTFAVVGTDDLSLDLHEALLSRAHWGYEFAGFVLDGRAPPAKLPGKVLGSLDELAQVLERHVIDLVVISAAPDRMKDLERAVAICDEQGVPVKLALDSAARARRPPRGRGAGGDPAPLARLGAAGPHPAAREARLRRRAERRSASSSSRPCSPLSP